MMKKSHLALLSAAFILSSLSFTVFADGDALKTFVDNDDITFELVSIDEKGEWGYTWNVKATNKTDTEVAFTTFSSALNNTVVQSALYAPVAAGETAEADLTWSKDDLAKLGITDVTKVDFELGVYDTEKFDTLFDETVTYAPKGEDAIKPYERAPKDSDIELFNESGVSLLYTGSETDIIGRYKANVFVNNTSNTDINVYCSGTKLNGVDCEGYLIMSVPAGYTAANYAAWYGDALEEAGIKDIQEITLNLEIRDSDWNTLFEGDVTFIPDKTAPAASPDLTKPAAGTDAPQETELKSEPESEPAPVSKEPVVIDSKSNVAASGAEGKTWGDLFQ